MRNIETIGRIVEVGARKRGQTRFEFADVAPAISEDETGSIHIYLWRQQINSVPEGRTVKIINGFVRIYANRLEWLNIRKNGRIIPLEEVF